MERRARALSVVALLAIGGVAACGDDDEPSGTTAAGIANPASEYCVAQGGTVEIVTEADGQVGYCNLPDGTRIEEWEYFTAQTGSTTIP